MRRTLLAGLLGLALAGPAFGQGPLTFKVTVRPATQPTPALKYTLLPELKDQTKGNALLRYYKGFSTEWWGNISRQPPAWHEAASKAQEAPLDQMPAEYAFVKTWKMLHEVDRGARMDHCDFEMLENLRAEGFATLLPDLQGMRSFVMYLALRARYELADGDIDKVIYTLQTGFALSRHIGEGPSLIHMLVGVAISQIMCKQLDALLEHPKCPSLYWALARLPQTFVDIRRPLQAEVMMGATLFPDIDELRKGPLPLDEAQKKMDEFFDRCRKWGVSDMTPEKVTLHGLAAYPKAKAALIRGGRPMTEVEAMPVPQVLLLHTTEEFLRLRDEMFKWIPLPYHEAVAGLEKAEKEIKESKLRADTLPIAAELLPAVQKSVQANVRPNRRFAMLRIVEALRLYAAAHDGQLPAKLADITEVPIPLDPATGKAFEYAASGNKATITGPQTAEGAAYTGMVYEVTLKK